MRPDFILEREKFASALPVLGEVWLQPWTLGERQAFLQAQKKDTPDTAIAMALLAQIVREEDGGQIWDPENWDRYCGAYPNDVMDLISRAREVAGLNMAEAKKK